MDFTLSLPLRVAPSMEAMSESVVVVGGISLITTVDRLPVSVSVYSFSSPVFRLSVQML